jgi:hypothetical protein
MKIIEHIEQVSSKYKDDDDVLIVIFDREKICNIADCVDIHLNEDAIDNIIAECENSMDYPDETSIAETIVCLYGEFGRCV